MRGCGLLQNDLLMQLSDAVVVTIFLIVHTPQWSNFGTRIRATKNSIKLNANTTRHSFSKTPSIAIISSLQPSKVDPSERAHRSNIDCNNATVKLVRLVIALSALSVCGKVAIAADLHPIVA